MGPWGLRAGRAFRRRGPATVFRARRRYARVSVAETRPRKRARGTTRTPTDGETRAVDRLRGSAGRRACENGVGKRIGTRVDGDYYGKLGEMADRPLARNDVRRCVLYGSGDNNVITYALGGFLLFRGQCVTHENIVTIMIIAMKKKYEWRLGNAGGEG